jgi:glycerophosphoryl diester phosphodiesterase
MFPAQGKPVIFGHRGASAHAPENTLAAFKLAAEEGAAGIELDAKLSADGTIMVIHDQTVDRTTQGSGRVNTLTLKALKTLDAGSKFSAQFKNEPIPTLEEVFQVVGQRLYINIELTNYASPGDELPELAARLVEKYGLAQRVLASSFNAANLVRFRRQLPGVAVCLLALKGLAGMPARRLQVSWHKFDGLNPYFSDVTPALVEHEHRRQRLVNVWTVNQPAEMRRLASAGIDGLITDDPGLARQTLAATVMG